MKPRVFTPIPVDPETLASKYHVIEPTLLEEEAAAARKIREIMFQVLDVNLNSLGSKSKAEEWFGNYIKRIVKGYKIKVTEGALDKIRYCLASDLIRHGEIEPSMHDHMIEDISCDGPGIPVYIWHRTYESLPTNIVFEDEGEPGSERSLRRMPAPCPHQISFSARAETYRAICVRKSLTAKQLEPKRGDSHV